MDTRTGPFSTLHLLLKNDPQCQGWEIGFAWELVVVPCDVHGERVTWYAAREPYEGLEAEVDLSLVESKG